MFPLGRGGTSDGDFHLLSRLNGRVFDDSSRFLKRSLRRDERGQSWRHPKWYSPMRIWQIRWRINEVELTSRKVRYHAPDMTDERFEYDCSDDRSPQDCNGPDLLGQSRITISLGRRRS